MAKLLYLLLAAGVITKSCTLSFGGDSGDGSSGAPNLGVPWVRQTSLLGCGPASVLMWALYDGMTGVTLTEIENTIGWTPSVGASQPQIVHGVNTYTRSGKDAGLGYPCCEQPQASEIYFSEEVTSINNGTPFIAFINGASHSGVASGGSWHLDPDTNYYVWDAVVLQDPNDGPNQPYISGDWALEDVTHIVSLAASEEAGYNYNTYGRRVVLRGGGGIIEPPPM